MDGEMDWIAARFLLSTILGVHPLVVLDGDGGRDDEHFPVDDDRVVQRVTVPAAVEAPEGLAGVSPVCAVCTEEVAAGQAVVRLPCAHWYHAGCIAPWLRIRSNCPTCRAELPREGGAAERPRRPAEAATELETAGSRLRREASYTMLAGTVPS
ncbi:E3 ubiquitin-protein ligase SDIR1-like [Panicum miliaceum]|uniref:E3 ubiquitin-protein ligase SDIR1-like n=1 Tax=Panicum miliaceum TaxID=4540 RepID=A0A3L6T9H7_PANMI|nr:E3 ubiquitin-protein ligase SDIR1-like [Panicum miliaceum]